MPFSVIIIGGFPYSSLMKFNILRNPNGETFSQDEPESSQVRSAIVPAPLSRSNLWNCFVKLYILYINIIKHTMRERHFQMSTVWLCMICYGYCRNVGTCLPICVIMLKLSIVHRKCQNSCVMVEPKIIIGTLNPLNLLRSELWQPGEILFN